jgi:autotransporter-associated beta strand protein
MGNGSVAGTSATYNLSGGSLLTTGSIFMGVTSGFDAANPNASTINVSGTGVLTAGNLRIGRYDLAGVVNTTNTFNQTAGTTTVNNLGLGGNSANASNSTGAILANLNLTGGTFTATNIASLSAGGAANASEANKSFINIGGTAQVTLGTFGSVVKGQNSTATITFDSGATGFLAPVAASTNYMKAGTFTSAFLTANGANFNVGSGKDITIGQVLENASGAAGTLTKSGVGLLTLLGNNTYTGATTVSAGTLVVTNSILRASINSNSTTINFANPPLVGTTNNVLSGPLNITSLASTNVTGLLSNTVGILTNNPNLQVIVTSASAGPTFGTTYPENSENAVGSNGLKNLMNYALGGTGLSSTPALPVLISDGTSLSLKANIRNSGQGVNVVGEYTYDLAGTWTEVELTEVTGATSTVPNTTVKAFSQDIESGQPRKFMRLKAIKQ